MPHSPGMRSSNPSRPQSPLSINLPSPYSASPPRSRVTTPYSPLSSLAQQSPRSSYFPHVPSRQPSPSPPSPVASPASPAAAAAPQTPHVLPPTPDAQSTALFPSSPDPPPPLFPAVSSLVPRSLAEMARVPDPDKRPRMRVESNRFAHILSVPLPGYAPEEVTITATRTDALKVVADRWSSGADDKCHLEWFITFAPRDANIPGIHACFRDNHLNITVPRTRPLDDPSSRVSLRLI
ncbi:hypothetical protein AURDEDRAFT_122036 [Auricularia subglabra TFB-10046 SS5]|nr:hypothetical protein AURDEDRAFT_122036 [Auricularia subglabra TFB-10046 SS5]